MSLDTLKVPEDTEYLLSSFIQNKVSKVRPVKYKGFAKDWAATQKWNIWDENEYLSTVFGHTQCKFDRLPIANDDSGEYSEYKRAKAKHSTSDTMHIRSCIELILDNTGMLRDEKKYVTFAEDFVLHPSLRNDTDYKNSPLRSILKPEGETLSIFPIKIKRKPNKEDLERFICVLEGKESFKMIHPVFKENVYQGVYDDLHPEDIPTDIDLFNVDAEKYPLLEMASDYILHTDLEKGDCLYVPSLFWI